MQKQSLAERIIAFLKGGDEAKLSRFERKLNKYLDTQITLRKESIDKLKEKISDATEVLNDSLVQVDTTRITESDTTDTYVANYVKNASAKLSTIEQYEADIKEHEEEIARFEKLRGLIYAEAPAQA